MFDFFSINSRKSKLAKNFKAEIQAIIDDLYLTWSYQDSDKSTETPMMERSMYSISRDWRKEAIMKIFLSTHEAQFQIRRESLAC